MIDGSSVMIGSKMFEPDEISRLKSVNVSNSQSTYSNPQEITQETLPWSLGDGSFEYEHWYGGDMP